MNNPFVLGLRKNPAQFLAELHTPELGELAKACVALLEARARQGDREAPPLLQALYRTVAYVKI